MSITILDNGIHLATDAPYAWFRFVDRDGRQRWRVLYFQELYYFPIESRENPDVIGQWWAAMRGFYDAGVDFAYAAAGMFQPSPLGVIQFYGAGADGDTEEEARRLARERMNAVIATLANFPQARLRVPRPEILARFLDMLHSLPRVLAVLGHPDPRRAEKGLGRDGSLGDVDEELASQQIEMLLRGMAKLRRNFAFVVAAKRVPRDQIIHSMTDVARLATLAAQRQRGSINVGFNISVPLLTAIGQSLSGSRGGSESHVRSRADGVSEGWTQGEAHGTSYTRSESETVGEAHSQGRAVTTSEAHGVSHAETNSVAKTSSWAKTTGGAETRGQADTVSQAHTVGGARTVTHTKGVAHTQGTFWSRGETTGTSITEGQSEGTSWSRTDSWGTGESHASTRGKTEGWSSTKTRPPTMEARHQSEGYSRPNPDNPPTFKSRPPKMEQQSVVDYGDFKRAYDAVQHYGRQANAAEPSPTPTPTPQPAPTPPAQGTPAPGPAAAPTPAPAPAAQQAPVAQGTPTPTPPPPQYGQVSLGPGSENSNGSLKVGAGGILPFELSGAMGSGSTRPLGPTISAPFGTVRSHGTTQPAAGEAGWGVTKQVGGETITRQEGTTVTTPKTLGVSLTRGESTVTSQTEGTSSFESHSQTQGGFRASSRSTTTSHSVTNTQGGSSSTTRSESWGEANTRSWATTTGKAHTESLARSKTWANTIGGATTKGHATTDGWTHVRGKAITESEAHTWSWSRTRGEAWGESHVRSSGYQVGRSHVEGEARGNVVSLGGGRVFAGGFSAGVIPGISIGRSWQTEDDTAIRAVEALRSLESLLNQAAAEGGFITTAALLTDEESEVAAQSLVIQSLHSPYVPQPVFVRRAGDDLRVHALTMMANLEDERPFGVPHLWTRYGTLMTPEMAAALSSPALVEEGTALTVQERIPPGMAFYPDMAQEDPDNAALLGHQFSPETGDLTNVPVRLPRSRHFHTAILGDTSYGKTVFAERLVVETTAKWNLRTIVLDMGAGWRKLLNVPELAGRVQIYQLSPRSVRPLRWNPLQIGRNILPEIQWRNFADIFGALSQLGEKRQIHELRAALRTVYLSFGVLVDDPECQNDPRWGQVQPGEDTVVGAPVGTRVSDLTDEQRQRLAVHRSKQVGLADLYAHIETELQGLSARDIRRSLLEGILYRLEPLVHGDAGRQFAAGPDAMDINEIVPDSGGVAILEGGIFLDRYTKAFLLGWSAWHIYMDAVVQRIRRARTEPANIQIVFEEANKIFSGTAEAESREAATAEQFEAMWRDSRKYGIYLHLIAQSPHQIPAGILSSCANVAFSRLSKAEDQDIVLSAIHKSPRGFTDEPWRRFIANLPIGGMVVKFGRSMDRRDLEPIYMRPLIITAPEPTDDDIVRALGRIKL